MKKFLTFFAGLVLVLFSVGVNAATVTVQWNAVDTATGYRVYYGTQERVYIQPKEAGLDAGNSTTYSLTIPQVNDDVGYHFAVTAYNQYGESDYSLEAIGTITGGHAIPAVPVMTRMTIRYDNGDIVEFDYIARTVTTTPSGGVPKTQTF
jgi:hypothetical protein